MPAIAHIDEPEFSAQLIGQTEKALNGILVRVLAGTGLSEPEWVTLRVVAMTAGAADAQPIAGRLAGVFKTQAEDARGLLRGLQQAGVLQLDGDSATLTNAGRALHDRILAETTAVTERIWGDLPRQDLAIAGRLLGTILARANQELA